MAKPKADPTQYSPALVQAICDHVAGGGTVAAFCEVKGRPAKGSVFRWLAKYPEFAEAYSLAMTAKSHATVDEMQSIADGIGLADDVEYDAAKVRNQLSTRQWIAERTNPKRYGPKTGVELSGEQKIVVELVQF